MRKYRPDFLIRLDNNKMLILETKGPQTDQDRTKAIYMQEWVNAVNEHGGFGTWAHDISLRPQEIKDILYRHNK